jgi:hypothetical protein
MVLNPIDQLLLMMSVVASARTNWNSVISRIPKQDRIWIASWFTLHASYNVPVHRASFLVFVPRVPLMPAAETGFPCVLFAAAPGGVRYA